MALSNNSKSNNEDYKLYLVVYLHCLNFFVLFDCKNNLWWTTRTITYYLSRYYVMLDRAHAHRNWLYDLWTRLVIAFRTRYFDMVSEVKTWIVFTNLARWVSTETPQKIGWATTIRYRYDIIIAWQTLFTWLWRWLPLRLSKRQSPTTVLFRTTITRTITLYELLDCIIRIYKQSLPFGANINVCSDICPRT